MAESFYNLNIWKKGYELILRIYHLTKTFPSSERYTLTDQLRRSANAIIANIAESQGRFSFNDKIRVLYQARGEIFETRSHLKVAEGLGYVTEKDSNKLDKEYEGLLVGINKYINFLSKHKKNF
jgi:four helix bundle protein